MEEEDFSIRNEIESLKPSSGSDDSQDSPKNYFSEFLSSTNSSSSPSPAPSQPSPPTTLASDFQNLTAFQNSQLQTQQILNYLLLKKLSEESNYWKYLTFILLGTGAVLIIWFLFNKPSKKNRTLNAPGKTKIESFK